MIFPADVWCRNDLDYRKGMVIMKHLLRRTIHKDDRGLSLVEVLCAVAILSLITGVIGSIIVISSRTYRKGISETNIQQEAQIAADNIGNIVKNSYKVVYGSQEKELTASSEKEGDKKIEGSGLDFSKYTELSLITNEDVQYTILHDKDAKALFYQEYNTVSGLRTSPEVLARNIDTFTADTSKFKDNRTIKLDMTVYDKDTDRTIPLHYTMTSRNSKGEGEYVSSTDRLKILFLEDEAVLVPGETYSIPVNFSKTPSDVPKFMKSDVEEVTEINLELTPEKDYVNATVPLNVTDEVANKGVSFKIVADGESSAYFKVYIRKVEKVKVNYTVDLSGIPDGSPRTYEEAGSVFTFTAGVTGNRLAIERGMGEELGDALGKYKPAQAVDWEYKVLIDGSDRDEDGNEYTNQYIKLVSKETGERDFKTVPTLVLELDKDMPMDFKLIVTATSKHATGYNKKGTVYKDQVEAEKIKGHYYDTAEVEARRAVPDGGFEITLEPFEEGTVKLNTKGGRPKIDIKRDEDYYLIKDPTKDKFEDKYELYTPTDGTQATYDPATDTVKITLGKDEMGSGANGTVPYTFVIGVKINGDSNVTSIITVHIRRVDYVHIDPVLNKDDNQTMDLRLRFNADKKDDNLIKYLVDGEKQDETGNLLNKALSVRVTIEVLGKNGSVRSGLTQIAEWGTYAADSRDKNKENSNEEIIKLVEGKWRTQLRVGEDGKEISDKDYNNKKSEAYKKSKVIYQLENTKPARIKGSGTSWTLEQTPELDIKPLALGEGEKIKVTMEALHPAGNNNAKQEYKKDVLDVYILDGQEVINVAKQRIVVEPYQVKGSGNGPMLIPVHVSPSVGAIKVKLEGHEKATNGAALTKVSENNNVSGGINDEWTVVRPADGKNVMNLELDISRTEEGALYDGKNGRIKMTLEAYTDNTLSEFLESTWAYLEVRRVTKVEISENSKKNFKNEVGKEIVLTAQASGIQGTEYFERQKKEGTDKFDPVWDQGDKYKSPYKLRWSLYHKENGKEFEKTISDDYSEYFSNVNSSEDGNGNQTIKFTLNKALPVGWEIRATSEHVGDKNGKAVNRSGLNYVKDIDKYKKAYPEGIVFDYIKVQSSRILADGFQRAGEYWFLVDETFPDIRNYFLDVPGAKIGSFYRYSIADQEQWTPYYMDDQNNWKGGAKFDGNRAAMLFMPEKEYDLDVISVVYDDVKKIIYWPLDSDSFNLLTAGTGWGPDMENYRLWDGKIEGKDLVYSVKDPSGKPGSGGSGVCTPQEIYDIVKKIPHQEYKFRIPRTEMYFNTYKNPYWDDGAITVNAKTTTVGSETEPLHFKNGDKAFKVNIEPSAFLAKSKLSNFSALVQKKADNGKWVDVKDIGYGEGWNESEFGFFLNVHNTPYEMYNFHSEDKFKGLYRLCVNLKEDPNNSDGSDLMRWKRIEGVLSNRKYVSRTDSEIYNIPLYNIKTGEGIIYFQID